MKKIILVVAIISSIIAISNSCKKGENDPFLSIRSRDSRIVGTWQLSNVINSSTTTIINGISANPTVNTVSITYPETESTTDFKIKRTKYVETNDIKDSVFSETLVINEDGTYSDTIKSAKYIANATLKYTTKVITNKWYWLSAKKNKESIMLNGYGTFYIDRLSWKEIVFKSSEETSKETSSNSIVYNITKEITFKRN